MRHRLCFVLAFCVITITSVRTASAEEMDSILGVKPVRHNPKSMLVRSGVAHDASENILGIISVKEPKSFFKPDAKQMTWWGEFKPFKFWGRPKLEARWHSPSGEQVATQQFKGEECALAKSTLKMKGPAQEGTWRVDVYHEGNQIDSKNFVVYGGPKAPVLKLDLPEQDGVKLSLKVEVQSESGAPSMRKEFLDKTQGES